MWWFDVYIYCEIINMIKFINTSITFHGYFPPIFFLKNAKIYSLSRVQVYSMELLTIVIMLDIRSSEFIYLMI